MANEKTRLLETVVSFIKDPADEKSVDECKREEQEWMGLTLAELRPYVSDPWWRQLRYVLFVVYWLTFFAFLSTVFVNISLAPSCQQLKVLNGNTLLPGMLPEFASNHFAI